MSTGYGPGYAYGESSVAFASGMNGRGMSLWSIDWNEINMFCTPTTEMPQVEVKADVPEVGVSRTPIEITFTFTNKTESLLPLELSITDSNNFMFSGNKQVRASLMLLLFTWYFCWNRRMLYMSLVPLLWLNLLDRLTWVWILNLLTKKSTFSSLWYVEK